MSESLCKRYRNSRNYLIHVQILNQLSDSSIPLQKNIEYMLDFNTHKSLIYNYFSYICSEFLYLLHRETDYGRGIRNFN